jgi:hypothetical protein
MYLPRRHTPASVDRMSPALDRVGALSYLRVVQGSTRCQRRDHGSPCRQAPFLPSGIRGVSEGRAAARRARLPRR